MKSFKSLLLRTTIIAALTFTTGYSFSQTRSDFYMAATADNKNAGNKIEFISADENFLVFELSLFGLPPKGIVLSIENNGDNLIFEERIIGHTYTMRYKVARNGMNRINFKAIGKGFSFSQTFTIKTEEKLLVIKEGEKQ